MKRILFIFLILLAVCGNGWAANTCVISDAGGNWSASTAWTNCGGTIPQAGDSVAATATSGNLVVDAETADLAGFDLTNYVATLSGDNYSNFTGNLVFPDGFTNNYARATRCVSGTCNITLGSSQTIYALEIINNVTMNLLSDVTATAAFEVHYGTLNTNNHDITTNEFWDHTTGTIDDAITMNLGSSTINVTGTNPLLYFTSVTGRSVTISSNTATINIGAGSQTHDFGSANWNGATINITTVENDTATIAGDNTFGSFNITGAASLLAGAINFSGNNTITSSATWAGNSQVNRPLIKSSVPGTRRTLTMTGAALTATDVDLQDIYIAGSPTITKTRVGDCGGNSGGAISASKTVYAGAVAGTIYFTDNIWADAAYTNYDTRAAAVSLNNYPLPQDTAIFDDNSFAMPNRGVLVGGTSVTLRVPTINGSAVTSSQYWFFATATVYGSLNMTGSGWLFGPSNDQILTLDAYRGKIILNYASFGGQPISINSNGYSVVLGDDVTTTNAITLTKGILNLHHHTITGTLTNTGGTVINTTPGFFF